MKRDLQHPAHWPIHFGRKRTAARWRSRPQPGAIVPGRSRGRRARSLLFAALPAPADEVQPLLVITFLAVAFAAGLMGMALMRRHRRDRTIRRPGARPRTPDDDDLSMAE